MVESSTKNPVILSKSVHFNLNFYLDVVKVISIISNGKTDTVLFKTLRA